MEQIRRSLSLQLVLAIVGALALLLSIVAAVMVKSSSDDTRVRIDQDISALITLKSNEIGNYFYAKGQIIHSVFANPAINNWFAKYHSRGSDLSLDPGYQQMVDYFHFFSEQDKEIKSVFSARPIPSSTLISMAVTMAIPTTTPTNVPGGRRR